MGELSHGRLDGERSKMKEGSEFQAGNMEFLKKPNMKSYKTFRNGISTISSKNLKELLDK